MFLRRAMAGRTLADGKLSEHGPVSLTDLVKLASVRRKDAMAQRRNGAKTQKRKDAMTQRRKGAKTQRRKDANAQRRKDAKAQRRKGAKAQRRKDAKAQANNPPLPSFMTIHIQYPTATVNATRCVATPVAHIKNLRRNDGTADS